MVKYAVPGFLTSLIISIILFSFIKEEPSYGGVAMLAGKGNNRKSDDIKNESAMGNYGNTSIPEIHPLVIIDQNISESVCQEEPPKKETPKKEKKKQAIIISPVKDEIVLVTKDTFVAPVIESPDTLSARVVNDQNLEPNKRKKKKKKFLFF